MRKVILLIFIALLMKTGAGMAQSSLNMRKLAMMDYWTAERVCLDNDLACFAAGRLGVRIVDLSDPQQPAQLASLQTTGPARGVAVLDEFLLVAEEWAGLVLYNLADPVNPTEIAFWDDAVSVTDVAIDEPYAFLACDTDGFRILDISDPSSPTEVGSLGNGMEIDRLSRSGSLVFGVNTTDGLKIIDVSDPSDPELRATRYCRALDVAAHGNCAYLALANNGIGVVDFTNLQNLRYSELLNLETPPTDLCIDAARSILYAAGGNLRAYSLANPLSPSLVGTFFNLTSSKCVALANDEAAVGYSGVLGGMSVLAIENPAHPSEIGRCLVGSGVVGVVARGEHAFLIGSLITSIDVSDPERPVTKGWCQCPQQPAYPLDYVQDYIYVPCGSVGMRVYSVRNPDRPEDVGGLDGFTCIDVKVENGCAVALSQNQLVFLDVTQPAHVRRIGEYNSQNSNFFRSVVIHDGLAYVASLYGGLRILDISDPRHVHEIGSLPLEGMSHAVAYDAGYAYIAEWSQGSLHVIDARDPFNPVEVGLCENNALSRSAVKSGNLLYVASDFYGMRAFNVENPASPVLAGFYDEEHDGLSGVAVGFEQIVLGAGNTGFYVYENEFDAFSAPSDNPVVPLAVNLASFPNPFNSATRLTFNLSEVSEVRIDVFDLSGRLVEGLLTDHLPAGNHALTWNAESCAAGVYLVRMNAGGYLQTRKLSLVR